IQLYNSLSAIPGPMSALPPRADYRLISKVFRWLLERPDLSDHDFYLFATEFPYDKAVETFVVRAAVVAQKPDSLLLANHETVDTVGAVVHAGGVATESNVTGELIDFVPKG